MTRTDSRVSITLPPTLKDEMSEIAKRNGRSLLKEIEFAVQKYVAEDKKRAQIDTDSIVTREQLRAVLKEELLKMANESTEKKE